MNLKKRLARIERRTVDVEDLPTVLFIDVVDASKEGGNKRMPLAGWWFDSHQGRIEIFRQPGESDDELEQRAIAEAEPYRRHGAVTVFLRLTEGAE